MQPESVSHESKSLHISSHIQDSLLVFSFNIEEISLAQEWLVNSPGFVDSIDSYCAIFPIDSYAFE